MFLILIALFIGIPVLDLYLLFTVGAQIGALNTVLIIIVTGVLGASLAKSQGLELLLKIQSELNQGKIPTGKLLQGFLVMGGGLLLLTPGFITDFLGFAMVLPGSRTLLAAFVGKVVFKGLQKGMANGNIHVFSNMKSGPFERGPFERGPFGNDSYSEEKLDSNTFEAQYEKKSESDEGR